MALLASCGVSLKVLDKRAPDKPFSRIMIIYVDDPFEFFALDSVTYDIGIKSCFRDTADFVVRNKVEELLSGRFSDFNTDIVKSADVFNVSVNSYDDFQRQLDSLNIDAILLINLRRFDHSTDIVTGNTRTVYKSSAHYGPGDNYRISNSSHTVSMPDTKSESTDATFKCYLIKSKDYLPVWSARFEASKGGRPDKKAFANKISQGIAMVAKKLSEQGYITGQ